MIKCYCDKCKKEVPNVTRIIEYEEARDAHGIKLVEFVSGAHDLCDECNEKFMYLNIDIVDYMKLSEEEIELLYGTFKVGDKVITSTGECGVITDICTCEQCKERGFYEPIIETKVGSSTIYITDNDKRANFRRFYKIGNRVFGNIDEDALLNSIERNQERTKELNEEWIELRKQRDILKHYKKKLNGGDAQ